MIDYQYDDGGRAAAGYEGKARDCVARALAIVTGRPYAECYSALAEANAARKGVRSARNAIDKRDRDRVFAAFGLRKAALGRGGRPTYTEAHAEHGDCIVSTARHVCAIKGGALRDTFDGRVYDYPDLGRRERKAMSVWTRAGR